MTEPSANPSEPTVERGAAATQVGHRRKGRVWVAGTSTLIVGSIVAVLVMRDAPVSHVAAAADVPQSDGNRITFSEAFAQRAGLQWSVARTAPLVPTVSVVGTVAFDPEHVAAVGTRMRGLVQRVFAHEGDRVERGQPLAEIDSPELGEAQAAVAMYRAQRHAAARNAEREADLAQRNLSTARESEVARAELAEVIALQHAAEQKVEALGGVLADTTESPRLGIHVVRSPLSGTVIERHIAPGQSVEGHLVAFRVTNLDRVWVELAVFEQNLSSIAIGDPVEIRSLGKDDDVIAGRVANVGASIDPSTRSTAVRVEIDNSARKLRIGQSITAQIQSMSGSRTSGTLIPNSAITYVDGRAVVFVADSNNAVVVRPVTLGHSDGSDQQVLSGVKPGERVVSAGVFALKSELFR